MNIRTLIASAASTAILSVPAFAQVEQNQVAEQCLADLRSFGERIQEEGYWLTGVRDRWGTGGWGGTAAGTRYYPGVGMPGAPAAAPVEGTAVDETQTPTGAASVNPPAWGMGIHSPGVQIETLFRGAQVLAVRGDQEGCNAVLDELTQLYDEYVGTLQEAGVEPGEVTGWRQEMIVAAQPVDELVTGRISIDDFTGAEVRNMQDEYLGDVDDAIITDGQLEYLIVAEGGFLGLGEDYVAVPWEAFQATPNLNLFLLDVPEETFEQAPLVAGDVRELSDAQRDDVTTFWQTGD